MNNSISLIPLGNLAMGLIPALVVVAILYIWKYEYQKAIYACMRMVFQLLLIGYLLSYLFGSDNPALTIQVLLVMLAAASWISLRASGQDLLLWYPQALGSIAIGGAITLMVCNTNSCGVQALVRH